MPGLDQLRQFSEDVAKIGNELKIREERGESLVKVPLPVDIAEEDDSDDFALGMPLQDDGGLVESAFGDDGPLSSLDGGADHTAFPELDSLLNPEPADDMDFSDFPELDALLNSGPESAAAMDSPADIEVDALGGNEVELSLDEEPVSMDSLPNDDDAGNLAGNLAMDTETVPAEVDGPSMADLPDFSVETDDAFSEDTDVPVSFDGTPESSFDGMDFELPDFDGGAADASDNLGDSIDSSLFDTSDLDSVGLDSTDEPQGLFDSPESLGEGATAQVPAGSDEFDLDTSGLDEFNLDAAGPDRFDSDADFDMEMPEPAVETDDFASAGEVALDADAFVAADDGDSLDADFGSVPEVSSDADTGADSEPFATDEGEAPSIDSGSDEPSEAGSSDFGLGEMDGGDASDSPESEQGDIFNMPDESFDMPGESFEVPDESFDVAEDPLGGSESAATENFADFDIPGFSDQAAGAAIAKPKRTATPGQEGKKEKNTLTDKEYETFLKNLKNYPLNVRIELQKLIVGDEFKDEVVFDLIQKVIKKVSARQLATQLEKLLDVSIPVPREFEKRTAAQYEAYKKSAEYQLKNRILPVAFISLMAACIMFIVFLFGWNFVYEPLRANALYKEGYALLEEGAYPQSETKFDEALTFQQQKRWFFRYAEGYRRHKQYERARMMYRAGLQRFNQDKEFGLDYAEMELYDLRNFENAETVVRREVLDHHINDPDGMLLLGDIYLEWGDERDPSKYENAKEVYDDLMQLYGQKDLYLARMMRYYIRVDDLRNVLQMKEYFYPRTDSLGGQDLVELSGYLLDKSLGNIAPADEYLFSSIEDVRELLERAVAAAPDVPESLYNMGLYFLDANNNTAAKDWFSAALDSFERAEHKPRKRLLRQLNTYRLLGDLDVESKEYISAEERYRTGISLYEKAAGAGLAGDENVGRMYAALGDINYLVTGDFDEALRNYSVAVDTHYDVPTVRYKMGYINYSKKDFGEALNLFIKTADSTPSDTHVLLALGNALSSRGDNFAAQGYYQRLIDILDRRMVRYDLLSPSDNDEHNEFVSMYNRAANNLGVTLYRLARQTGNSSMNAEALTNFTASMRAWDALTRDPETFVRSDGSNLAERNIRYMSMPVPDFEPSIYPEIPAQLEGEFIPK